MAKYFMLNKPMGCITARSDPRHRTVSELFPEELRDEIFPVGRLDKDTEGLLIFTDDGMLNHKLLSPENHIDKTYLFYAIGNVDRERFFELARGAEVFPGKDRITSPAVVKIIGETNIEHISAILPPEFSPLARKKPKTLVTIGEITITEGKKHQVKHMVAYAGGKVVYLKRLAMGKLSLDEALEKGSYRPLSDEEISLLKNRTENV